MPRLTLLLSLLLSAAGCATAPVATIPIKNSAPAQQVPPATRVLGQAARYISATGAKLEVVHDSTTGVVIVKLPDDSMAILPAEILGAEGRYRDKHMTFWENDGGVLLWIDGALVFSGRLTE